MIFQSIDQAPLIQVTRIQNALEQLKVRIDPDAPTEKQVQDIVKRLPEVMPIRKSEMEGTITGIC